jgi:hypothetical protein
MRYMTRLELLEKIQSSKISKCLDDLRRQHDAGKLHGFVAFAFDGWETRMLSAGDVSDGSMSNWFRVLGAAFLDPDNDDDEEVIEIAA